MSGRLPDHVVRAPVSLQGWEHLTFLHYRYDAASVQRLVPRALTVQRWGGDTWVGITAFLMTRVRAPGLPPPPGWDAFGELNVRAYVRRPDGRDGLWFLGMLVPRVTFVASLRALGLPYAVSDADVTAREGRWSYRFGQPWRPAGRAHPWFDVDTLPGAPLSHEERTPLVDSLTGRWWAFHRRAGVLWRTPVAHEPWPLHHAQVAGPATAPLRWVGLPEPAEEPMVHAAPRVLARLGGPRPA